MRIGRNCDCRHGVVSPKSAETLQSAKNSSATGACGQWLNIPQSIYVPLEVVVQGGLFDMLRCLAALTIIALLTLAPSASAAEFGTRDEAVAMVKRVQTKFKQDGLKATLQAATDKSVKEFHDRDLYPFIYDLKGTCVAHGARPALIGKNLIDLKDQDGKFLIREMVAIANGPGHGWVNYKWPNPLNNKIEDKSSYIEKMGDHFVGVGIYNP